MTHQHIADIRSFNRFYTSVIGLLTNHLLASPYTLPEVRVLYEVCHAPGTTATLLTEQLGIDKGYLSRILQRLTKEGLVVREEALHDKRLATLSPSKRGREVFAALDQASAAQVATLVGHLSGPECDQLVSSMQTIRRLIQPAPAAPPPGEITIRTHLLPGDLGHVIARHGQLYAAECGFGIEIEAYVAQGLGEFYQQYDPAKDRVWVCEDGAKIIGFLLLMHRPHNTCQLRYFYLEQGYRGLGLGKRLIELFMDFYRAVGYAGCYLLTTHDREAAIALYERNGFRLVAETDSFAFGTPTKERRYELAAPDQAH
jgi:DNA-binding MarR family transcriptional regulator/GNAT superfamily N-acetyltransferase